MHPDQEKVNNATISHNTMPLAAFFVRKEMRYRFRMVSPAFTLCPIQVSIEGHSMAIIAADTVPVKPTEVQALVIHPGERLTYHPIETCYLLSFYYTRFI